MQLVDPSWNTVDIKAVSDASSKSFRDIYWSGAKLQAGDILLVQFGHNDQKKADPNRYTTIEDFKANLNFYIDGAILAGATPALVTSIERWNFDENRFFEPSLVARAAATREVASDRGVMLIDLHAYSFDRFTWMGEQGTIDFYGAVPGDKPIQERGEQQILRLSSTASW